MVHFALFVIGCRECHIRNKLPRKVYWLQPVDGAGGAVSGQYYHQLATVSSLPLPQQTLAQNIMYIQATQDPRPMQAVPPQAPAAVRVGPDNAV